MIRPKHQTALKDFKIYIYIFLIKIICKSLMMLAMHLKGENNVLLFEK